MGVAGFVLLAAGALHVPGQEGLATARASGADRLCVDTGRSIVRWVGTERVGDGHAGVVRLAGGVLERRSGAVRGGHVVVDMTTIEVTDIPPREVEARKRLASHLADGEFFDVERYPTARLDFTRIVDGPSGLTVTGDLAIRDSVHSVTFPARVEQRTPGGVYATARLVFDRWRWGVEFDGLTSALRNALVDDEIRLDIELSATRSACPGSVMERQREPIIGGPCEGCEAVFEGLPPLAALRSEARIAPLDEPGERMRVEGIVREVDGSPAPGVIVYAYHTDARGVYPPMEDPPGAAAGRHGRLRGWARTDARGWYRFDTIRPGGYPGRDTPQHVHMHVIEPGCCTYFLDSIHFTDDPRLTDPPGEDEAAAARGGSGLVTPVRDAAGVWVVRRDVWLGRGVPGHEAARRRVASAVRGSSLN